MPAKMMTYILLFVSFLIPAVKAQASIKIRSQKSSQESAAQYKKESAQYKKKFDAIELYLRQQDNTSRYLLEVQRRYKKIIEAPQYQKFVTKRFKSIAAGNTALTMMRLGDIETDTQKKIQFYLQGEIQAQRSMQLNPQSPRGPFFEIINSAKRAKAQGLFASITQIGGIFKRSERLLKEHPEYYHTHNALALFYVRVPSILGGDLKRAEEILQAILKKFPNYTAAKITYVELLFKQDRNTLAQTLIQQVLTEKNALRPYDCRKFDRPKARQFMKEL